MRKHVIAGNWKMNKVLSEAEAFLENISGKVPENEKVEAIVCAAFPSSLLWWKKQKERK